MYLVFLNNCCCVWFYCFFFHLCCLSGKIKIYRSQITPGVVKIQEECKNPPRNLGVMVQNKAARLYAILFSVINAKKLKWHTDLHVRRKQSWSLSAGSVPASSSFPLFTSFSTSNTIYITVIRDPLDRDGLGYNGFDWKFIFTTLTNTLGMKTKKIILTGTMTMY